MLSETEKTNVIGSIAPIGPPGETAKVVLSSREHELLALLSKGFSNKEIADELDIAYTTVKVHLKHIYEKLHVRSRTEALLKFMEEQGPSAPQLGRQRGYRLWRQSNGDSPVRPPQRIPASRE